ncbi:MULTISPECIES: HD domain-containing protein [unclassified Rickettsia]|uniref:HD domain-containing protein n=1 Tax=unclassified Rickettsia TaxID=114295 RepID=UPI003133169A
MKKQNNLELEFRNCFYSTRLLDKIFHLNKTSMQQIDISEINKAIYYARKYHGNQIRQTGEPYYAHPLEVAYMVANYTATMAPEFYQTYMLVTSILHDTIEDTELTEKLITEGFGCKIANQVESLSRNKIHGKISSEEILNILAASRKYDTIIIKFFDRIDNLQTLGIKSPEKAQKIIDETRHSFIPLAAQLNMPVIERQLNELCNRHLAKNHSLLQNFPMAIFEDNFQPCW